MNKVGVVSADGATTLDGLEAKLAESRSGRVQADTPLPPLTAITSRAGTAVIYK